MPFKVDLASGRQKTQWKVDPMTAPIVWRIYEMYIDGIGYKRSAQTLTNEGVPSPRGGPWNVYILHHNQPAYMGQLVFNREDNKNPGKKYEDKNELGYRERSLGANYYRRDGGGREAPAQGCSETARRPGE